MTDACMMPTDFSPLGESKPVILAYFAKDGCIEFLHWLYVPTLGVILSFDKQVCSHVELIGFI